MLTQCSDQTPPPRTHLITIVAHCALSIPSHQYVWPNRARRPGVPGSAINIGFNLYKSERHRVYQSGASRFPEPLTEGLFNPSADGVLEGEVTCSTAVLWSAVGRVGAAADGCGLSVGSFWAALAGVGCGMSAGCLGLWSTVSTADRWDTSMSNLNLLVLRHFCLKCLQHHAWTCRRHIMITRVGVKRRAVSRGAGRRDQKPSQ